MTTDVNILIRGQSNALLFVANGGARELEKQLEASLPGVNVNIIQHYGDKNSTIHSGTAFLKWDTDGQQQGLLNYVKAEPAGIKDNPTVTLWMHNEYDGNTYGVTTANWMSEVKTDAALVRAALGQSAETTPYVFTYVPYNYAQGTSPKNIQEGMRQLSADPKFNASFDTTAMTGLTMNGDGYAHSSHMGQADAMLVADRLSDSMKGIVSGLAKGDATTPPVATPPVTPPAPTPITPVTGVAKTIGAGADSLVLKISQDAWNGSAQYTISVDGKQIGGILTASASHAAGQDDVITVKGDWGAGSHKVTVNFINDAWGGTAATDRNLHVDGITFNGAALSKDTADLTRSGPVDFGFSKLVASPSPTPAPAPGDTAVIKTIGAGADTLVLKISQDAWNGNAQYTVSIDGKQVGGTLTAGALHGSDSEDTLTIKGDWGTGAHKMTVRFVNDASGTGGDRNLYVEDASFNGSTLGKHESSFKINGPDDFHFTKSADGLGLTFNGTTAKDVFAIQHGDGDVVIGNFTPGADKLRFEGFDQAAMHKVAASEGGVSGTLIIFDATAENVFLPHVTALAASDIIFA
ncbi:carbohydrate-binding domain-containing protein [Belnapia rosea]|uniref:Ca-dependent carbohydrate-binding module xylan-binding n=1 Tax=Belnapia rosea TaxID=938405 RepID=A0A1G6LLF5_9PROT|nr:carbohydrate-binding domain-containing protein [Belnapia rosea]SDC44132.1 Ca-dependent carbohydrate-binding module xylan-binding [Belnapia rosea]